MASKQGRHFGDSFSTLLFTWLEIYAMRRFWRAAQLAATTELAIRGTHGMRRPKWQSNGGRAMG